jgi:hypothetical protein
MIASFFAGFLVCLAGAVLYLWRQRVQLRQRPQIPKEWPLLPRSLLSSKERKIWLWLGTVMHDQHIMIKLPVTRFTIPARRSEAKHWYALLNQVYFTFTVCNQEGQVLGCVDVPGSAGLSMSNQTLKYGLLSQCGIPYWVIEPDNLPHMNQIRTAFLGDDAPLGAERERQDLHFKDVAGNLHAAVLRQRSSKHAPVPRPQEGPLSEGWEQNSFVAPLDSRSAHLHNDA